MGGHSADNDATRHRPECWCNGTGFRVDLGVPCNLPQLSDAEHAYVIPPASSRPARPHGPSKENAMPNRLNLTPRPDDRPEDVANHVLYAAQRLGVEPVDTDYAYAGYWAAIGRASDAAVVRGGSPVGQEATWQSRAQQPDEDGGAE